MREFLHAEPAAFFADTADLQAATCAIDTVADLYCWGRGVDALEACQ
jgi:hypothetical protein